MSEGSHTLFLNGNLPAPMSLKTQQGAVLAVITPCPGEPSERLNQDSMCVTELVDRSLILAVADGAGGHRGGDQASRSALVKLLETLPKEVSEIGWKGAILHAIDEANRSVLDLGIGALTTLVVAHINGDGARVFHVGDSEALVMGQRGGVKFRSIPHSPVGYALEAGLVNEKEALFHEERNIVSNLLGTAEMHIQISARVPLRLRDTLVLGSDGLFDNVTEEELTGFLRKGKLERQVVGLTELVRERMTQPGGGVPSKPDDLSFLVYRGVG